MYQYLLLILCIAGERRKREEERRKKEEGRGKKEEGRGRKEEGRRKSITLPLLILF
ncbi:MAG: hypothetical protein F6K54_07665 [Okeania sp. SIO3B5]|uniref:hypothetical protein n=1 Tax=Okeania sp. SIO3B5 TaxID=2607811 RepID=UPI001400D1C1|nr:hypothetical protein [Okeania sp. SIO3B5]NEO52966.1 hypothetical protein [Okeania sp. SIO3B5]